MTKAEELRKQYSTAGIQCRSVSPDPVEQFKVWFAQAGDAGIAAPNAMVLATVSKSSAPSMRTVLMKSFEQDGLIFFTNHGSRKGQQMQKNAAVSAVFPWCVLHRQVILEGIVERIDEESSRRYFHSRPRESQLGAWASRQSEVLESRDVLQERLVKITERFQGDEVSFPEFWGGYRLVSQQIEFWQGRPHRLHDRILYTRKSESWSIQRLSP